MEDLGYAHDPATAGMQFAHYRCEQCGEVYPLLVWHAFDVLVGRRNATAFAPHGPGCTHQTFVRVTDAVDWPQPSETLWKLRDQLP